MFSPAESGVLLPEGFALPESPLVLPARLREPSAEDLPITIVPDYDDLWDDGSAVTTQSLAASVIAEFGLDALSRLLGIYSLDSTSKLDKTSALVSYFPNHVGRKLQRLLTSGDRYTVFHPFHLLLTTQLIAAQANSTPKGYKYTSAEHETTLKLIYCVGRDLHQLLEPLIPTSPGGVAAALLEQTQLPSVVNTLLSAYGIWAWQPTARVQRLVDRRGPFEGPLLASAGLTPTNFVYGLAIPNLWYQMQDIAAVYNKSVAFRLPWPWLDTWANQACITALHHVSATMDEFAKACKAAQVGLPLMSLLPIKRTPVLRFDDSPHYYRPLSLIHVAEAALERPVRIREANDASLARTQFGELLEEYVHALLSSTHGDRYQRLERSENRPRADGVLWYPDGFIVVEIKSSRVAESQRYNLRTDGQYTEELTRGKIRHACTQLSATTSDILTGSLPCLGGRSVAASLIVVFQEIPRSVLAVSVLDRLLPQNRSERDCLVLRPQLVSFHEMEGLDKYAAFGLLRLLSEKMNEPRWQFDPLQNYVSSTGRRADRSEMRQQLLKGLRQAIAAHLVR